MGRISKAFLTGLVAILPIALTLYILVWLATSLESALGGLIRNGLGKFYVPGMGIVAGFVVILIIGLSLKAWIVRQLFAWGERLMKRIPIVKTVYGAVRDLIGFFSESKDKTMNQVVMVSLGDTKLRLIGFVTREDFAGYPQGLADKDTVAVYLPMSYQVGGFTVMLPRTAIQPIEMSFQAAMRFAITAGMSSGEA